MSNTIDERVVEMRFNNRQFETNVQTSIRTLDNLKKGLNLEGAAKSLSALDKVGKSFSLAGIAEGVDRISSKFTALGIIGVTALANITNSVVNAGKQLVSSLTIDPVKTGLEEYETKMNAITTILTNTKSKGTTLTDVNKTLSELNEYSDKTIYNFAEMTRNIGTFTAAGVGLKTSATSIKGIANLAAGSGSSAMQASTAMYQLSQAIAAGSVKLMDWNSVVNAGMGGELFQKALEKTAKELGHGRNMSVSFRESLESGWITTEVLTKTLAKLAADKSLIKAATQVTTFTKLLDTMKESVQSGWAVSWENIIGNKEESAKLFTSINNSFNSIAGASADARNKMLSFWKANGGRAAIIEAISNAFQGLKSILKPIGEAFREIFPAMTGKRLVEISKGIRDLTSHFKIGEETASNIHRTFKGLFAVLHIGKQAFLAIAEGIGTLIKYLLPAGGGLLSLTATIGDFLVWLDKTIWKAGVFKTAIQIVANVLTTIADGIKLSIGFIIDSFKRLGGVKVNTSGLDAFTDRVRQRFAPLAKIGEFMQTLFAKLAPIFQKIGAICKQIGTVIGNAFGELGGRLTASLENADFNTVLDIINGGLLAALVLGLKKFIKSLTSITDKAGGFLGELKGILDGVRGCLQAYQSQLKAGTLLKIAISVAILAAALIALSLIDSKKLTVALGAMTAVFTELLASMAIFDKIGNSSGFKSMFKITIAMVGLSIAVQLLASAAVKLSKLDWQGLAKGLSAVAVLAGTMVASAKILASGSGSLVKSSIGFILFGVALKFLASSVEKFAAIDTVQLVKGLASVGSLMVGLAVFMNKTKEISMDTSKGIGILLLAFAISTLADAVKKYGEIDIGTLIKGLAAVALTLLAIGTFVNKTGDAQRVISTAIGLTILGAAMLIFSKAIESMGNLSISQIAKGLITMALALNIISVALSKMPANMIVTGVGLMFVATALLILSTALTVMGGMTWDAIAKGLTVLSIALTAIAIATSFMTSALPGAAAILIISAALYILVPILLALGLVPLDVIGKSLLALGGIFLVFALGALLLAPLTPIIMLLGVALGLFGAACLAAGVGISLLAAGLAVLAVSGVLGAAALVTVVTGIAGLIPLMLRKFAEGIIELVKTLIGGIPIIVEAIGKLILAILNKIIELTPKIVEAATVLITGFLQVIINTTPKIVEAVFTLLKALLKAFVDYIPKLVDAGVKIILGFLKGIANNIGKIAKVAVDIIVNFIRAIGKETPRIIDAGFKMIIDFLNGLADAIRTNVPLVNDAIANLIAAMIEAFVDTVLSFFEIGANIVNGLIEGIGSMITAAIDAIVNCVSGIIDGAKSFLGIASPSKVFRDEVGVMIGKGLAKGIQNSSKEAADASSEMAKGVFDSAKEWIDERKYYNNLSLGEELYVWQEVQKKYKAGSEGYKNADKEVYRVRNELVKESYSKSIAWMDKQKYYNKLTLDEELAAWERVQKKYLKGTEERINADKEVYRVKNELLKEGYNHSVEWIDDEKYYNKLSLGEELAAWERIQTRYAKGTEERKKADREVYRLKNELVAKQTQLDEEYYSKTAAINEKLKTDIKTVTDTYERAVEARAKALSDSYGLFDEVAKQEDAVSGDKLLDNLQDQVDAFEDWQKQLHILSKKGMDEELLKELTEMGPKSLEQIQALNTLSSAELTQYVLLWREKHEQARKQSVEELEGMRIDTETKIKELNTQASKDLDTYKTTWLTKTAELTKGVKTEFTDLNTDVTTSMSTLNTLTQKAFGAIVTGIKKTLTTVDWAAVGTNIVQGITAGIKSNSAKLAMEAATMAKQALQAAKKALGIHSPSKEFENVGMYSVKGLAWGLKKFAGLAVTEAKDVGSRAINSLSAVMSNIAEIVSGELDMVPTIRPVLDLSNIKMGSKDLSSLFKNEHIIATNVRANALAEAVSNRRTEQTNPSDVGSKTSKEDGSIANIFNIENMPVREEADIRKIARQLYQLQIAGSRG